jgi:orotidine-5'-phosphate decarboxylase
VVNSSRGVTFPFRPDDAQWEAKVAAAAHRASEELRAAG